MDANRFDALTRGLTGAAPSRRRLLTGVGGGGLGVLATVFGLGETGATHSDCRHVGVHCNRNGQCCSSRCRNNRCRAHNVGSCTAAKDYCVTGTNNCGGGSCACFRTTGGANFCSSVGGRCMDCTTDAQCSKELGVPGLACVEFNSGFCDLCPIQGFSTACLTRCTA